MNKRFFVLSLGDEQLNKIGLLACAVLFLLGTVAGAVTAGFVNEETELGGYFSAFLSLFLTGADTKPDFFSAVVDVFKYNLAAIALGFSILGIFLIPVLAAVRGFFLSFSISTVVRVIGSKGVSLALAIFGANTMITVPCFFVLSVYAYSASRYIYRLSVSKSPKLTASPFHGRFFVHCGICLLILLISALIDCYVTPRLISLAALHI